MSVLLPDATSSTGFGAVVRREWKRLRADLWDVGMLTWIPLVLYAVIWGTYSASIARDVPIVVVDEDRSGLSRTLVRKLDASPGIRVAGVSGSEAEALGWLRERRAYGVLVVPDTFQQDVVVGRAVSVPWFYNGQFSVHVGSLNRDVRSVVASLSNDIELADRTKRGVSQVQADEQFESIQTRLMTLFNENTSYESFLVLALIPSMLQIFVALAAITTIGRELRAGTVADWLHCAGGRWSVAIAGKMLIPAACFALHAVLFIAFFAGVLGWAVEGSAFMVVVGLLLLIAAYLGVGILLIATTLSFRNALSTAAFITAPAFAFSGQGYPLLAMPAAARAWAEALPLTHYLQLQSVHWLAGAPWIYGVREALILALFAVVTGGGGLWLLKLRAEQPSTWGRL